MARTFTCNEEIIVVSKGTEDIGKLAMLGNGGKFDPSVIPTIEKQATMCRVSKSTSQSIPSSTGTKITFDVVDFDLDNMHDTVNPSRIVVPSDGVYQIMGQVVFSAQGTAGVRSLAVMVNGSIEIGLQSTTSNGVNTYGLNTGSIYSFKKGDYIELLVYQTSSGAVNITSDISVGITSLSVNKLSN